jgi:dienelactone hydrolase
VITHEGWELVGDLTRPNQGVGGPAPAVLMLNGAGRDRTDYAALARRLAALGLGSLRLDLRGMGASTNLGRFVPFDSTGHNDSLAIHRSWSDVRAALAYLAAQPWVDPDRLGALGASFSGESVALAVAGRPGPRAVVALSPGSFSDSSLATVDRDGRHWLFVYSSREMIVRRWDMARWTRRGTTRGRVLVVLDSAHASRLLPASPFLTERLAEWFSRALGAEPADPRWREAADRVAVTVTGPDDLLRPGADTPYLGDGTAGRLHFLLAWHRDRRDAGAERAARRSADRLVELMAAVPDSADVSLYRGIAGPAVVLLDAADQLGEPRYQAAGMRLLDRVRGSARRTSDAASWSPANDVLTGDAGTAAALYAAWRQSADTSLRDLAFAAGRSLLARSRSDSGGANWRWRESGPMVLPNFSHGAAGIGTVLALLGRDLEAPPAFLEAATGAARYLRSIARRDDRGIRVPYGWPVPDGGWGRPFDAGWAHGQAGTARLFWELWRATRDSSHLRMVLDAVRGLDSAGVLGTPAAEYGAEPFGVDYRFGLAGIGDLFADLYDETGDRAYLDRALTIATAILERADSTPDRLGWTAPRRVFMEGAGEPALFTGWFHGAAGPGVLFLKLDALLHGRRPPSALPDGSMGEW